MKLRKCAILLSVAVMLSGCAGNSSIETVTSASTSESVSATVSETVLEKEDIKVELTKSYKTRGNTNPIMTQAFGADPYALVVDDTIYIYMTSDAFEYDASGEIKENTYGKINTIHLVSTKDMKNFTDHGEIKVAGKDGAAKWAKNSWAPAAAHKVIDGKDKYFLYFADNGGGIGVVVADSPEGPYVDPLGHALISRSVPTCAEVLWLFDPAVLVDDDGSAYIYFGGGVPEGKTEAPGTGRVCKLGDDMISLDGDPVAIDVPYLFEDSGIHKFNNKYYYTYCTNWNVPSSALSEYGFQSGEIAMLESDSPMGPFTYKEKILSNPGSLCGLYGNNHHALFEFNGKHYIVYHSRLLEKSMGVEHNYRATFINEVSIKEDGHIGVIPQSKEGPDQLAPYNPYETHSAVTVSNMVGTNAVAADEIGYGNMKLGEINTGDYIELTGVDFGTDGATKVTFTVDAPEGVSGHIMVRTEFPNRDNLAVIEVKNGEVSATFDSPITGTQFVYIVFEGEGYEVNTIRFEK